MKKSLLLIFLLLPIYGFSGVFFNTPLNMQAGDFAQKYAEKKYGIDFEVSTSTYFRRDDKSGHFYVILQPINKDIASCQVDIAFKKPNEFSIRYPINHGPDNCGASIINYKFKNYLEKNIISKYYDPKDISMGAQLQCLINDRNCQLTTNHDFFNNKGWNLSIEELLQKYSDNLAVKSVNINIFSQKETPESIAKAMEFAFALNKYLSGLTGTHKIKSLYIYMYPFSHDVYKTKYKGWGILSVPFSKENPEGVIYGNIFRFGTGGAAIKYTPITKSNRKEIENIKNTKYYQPVKEILSKSKVIK